MDTGTGVCCRVLSSNFVVLARASMRYLLTGDASDFTCNVPFSNTATEAEAEDEPLAEGSVLLAGDVAVGESIFCQGTYVLTSDDIDALQTISTAAVWAADKFDKKITGSATATTSLDQVRPTGRKQIASTTVFQV